MWHNNAMRFNTLRFNVVNGEDTRGEGVQWRGIDTRMCGNITDIGRGTVGEGAIMALGVYHVKTGFILLDLPFY